MLVVYFDCFLMHLRFDNNKEPVGGHIVPVTACVGCGKGITNRPRIKSVSMMFRFMLFCSHVWLSSSLAGCLVKQHSRRDSNV